LEDEGLPYEEEALPRKGVFPLFPLLSISILKRVLFQRQSVPKKIASRDRITTKIFGKGGSALAGFLEGKTFLKKFSLQKTASHHLKEHPL
jgi:hypothetical protein